MPATLFGIETETNELHRAYLYIIDNQCFSFYTVEK